jgi:hypothetical protein
MRGGGLFDLAFIPKTVDAFVADGPLPLPAVPSVLPFTLIDPASAPSEPPVDPARMRAAIEDGKAFGTAAVLFGVSDALESGTPLVAADGAAVSPSAVDSLRDKFVASYMPSAPSPIPPPAAGILGPKAALLSHLSLLTPGETVRLDIYLPSPAASSVVAIGLRTTALSLIRSNLPEGSQDLVPLPEVVAAIVSLLESVLSGPDVTPMADNMRLSAALRVAAYATWRKLPWEEVSSDPALVPPSGGSGGGGGGGGGPNG